MGLVLHELATNAAKYGALSHREGQLEVTWAFDNELLDLSWTERGCRDIKAPGRRGFGTKIITSSISQGGGDAQFEWGSDGLKFRLKLAFWRETSPAARPFNPPPQE